MREFPQSEKEKKYRGEGVSEERKKLLDKEELTTGKNEMMTRRRRGEGEVHLGKAENL